MAEKILAGIVLAACVGALIAMLLGPRRNARIRAALDGLVHWRSQRSAARREAERAIERARKGVRREGNVLRPRSFDRRSGDRDKH
jgi:hypothetical protein